MLRLVLLLSVLPAAAAFAQDSVHVVVTASNNTTYRISRSAADSTHPIFAQGKTEFLADPASFGTLSFATTDAKRPVHVVVQRRGQDALTGDGSFVVVHRDERGLWLEARSEAPAKLPPNDVRRP